MSGFDLGQVFSVDVGLSNENALTAEQQARFTKTEAQSKFRQFIREFRNSEGSFVYREMLKENCIQEQFFVNVDLADVHAFDSELYELLRKNPIEFIAVFEDAAQEVATALAGNLVEIKEVQVLLRNFAQQTALRSLSASLVSSLVCVSGLVVNAARPRLKARQCVCVCRNCKQVKTIIVGGGFQGARIPRTCDTKPLEGSGLPKCPMDPYMIVADECTYIDQQKIKLQESPEETKSGEMPRTLTACLERALVNVCKPGQRVNLIGCFAAYEAQGRDRSRSGMTDVGLRIPYLRVLGVEHQNEASQILSDRFTQAEEEEFLSLAHAMAQTGKNALYERISASIAPQIFGQADVKKAIALQLFGGVRKHLPDGMRLRGDINVLLLGDPSVAKSALLKFAHTLAPIGVYTSGKGASAAGLTASVLRDPSTGEFSLEGGALVLADGGLVCIDEFDKMREQDRVSIHEAMEQQTISIAKAGITTILNSRTSVLAAANPLFGRYDDMKSPAEQIDFQSTILSRFDLIFIVRDIQDVARDQAIAKYILSVHKTRNASQAASLSSSSSDPSTAALDPDFLKKYIAYARQKCHPRLNEEASDRLKHEYVRLRKDVSNLKNEAGTSIAAIPVTVRQLEAIIRLSESLARLTLSEQATVDHVAEAIRLFRISTFQAATANLEGAMSPDFAKQVQQVETAILQRVAVHAEIGVQRLANEMKRNFDETAFKKAIYNMQGNGKIKLLKQGYILRRLK